MIWQSNHRGVDFTIAPKGDGRWHWSFLTGTGPKFIISGDTAGSREDAILECQRAVEAFLATRPTSGDSPLAQLSNPASLL